MTDETLSLLEEVYALELEKEKKGQGNKDLLEILGRQILEVEKIALGYAEKNARVEIGKADIEARMAEIEAKRKEIPIWDIARIGLATLGTVGGALITHGTICKQIKFENAGGIISSATCRRLK